jgi:hypothetical protein
MRDEHWLRATQMRIGRHHGHTRRDGLVHAPVNERCQPALQRRDAPAQIEPEIERDLLVARTSGMEATAGIADPLDELALHEAVHVFVGSGHERRLAFARREDFLEAAADGGGVVSRQHSCGRERIGPRETPGHVVFEERAIEAERDAELERGGVGGLIEASGPERHE